MLHFKRIKYFYKNRFSKYAYKYTKFSVISNIDLIKFKDSFFSWEITKIRVASSEFPLASTLTLIYKLWCNRGPQILATLNYFIIRVTFTMTGGYLWIGIQSPGRLYITSLMTVPWKTIFSYFENSDLMNFNVSYQNIWIFWFILAFALDESHAPPSMSNYHVLWKDTP
jgi:hypothetical protein